MKLDNFKGIWIPSQLLELDISWTKRIIISEISQLEMLGKGCIASNSHFAEKLKLSNQAISKALNELAKDEIITIYNAQTKRNFGRKITINFSKSAINFGKSGVHQSGESKENIQKSIGDVRIKPKDFQYPKEFMEIWKILRTGDKWRAFRAYRKRQEQGYTQYDILRVVQAEAKKTFAKRHLSTTLNGEIDEVQENNEEEVWL